MKFLFLWLAVGIGAMAQLSPVSAPKLIASDAFISGSVVDQNGKLVTHGTVTFTPSTVAGKTIVSVESGRYETPKLDPATYDVVFEAPGYHSTDDAGVTLAAGQQLRLDVRLGPIADPDVNPEPDDWKIALALGAILFYLITILVTRWYKIAKPSRNFLLAHIAGLLNDLESNRRPQDEKRVTDLETKLRDIQTSYEKPRQPIRQFLFWSQSVENASWITVHQVERELTAYLSPPEAVQSSLIAASSNLRELGTGAATQIAAAIDTELTATAKNQSLRKQLLAEATSMLYQHRDDNYISLMDWQNKAMWLILACCLFLMLLAVAAGNAVLFLAGAAGGLLSRVMRTIKSSGVPVDYGASWTTLFLSPLFGAFCGWFGIGIIVLLANPDVGLLGKMFALVTWAGPLKLSTLTLAFMSGFSERFFDSLVAAVEQQAVAGGTSASGTVPAAAGTSPSSVAPQPVASVAPYDQMRQKIAGAIASRNADDKSKIIAFLEAMGQNADQSTSADGLTALVAKVEAVVGSDPDKQKRYMTEAVRAGIAAS